jgi:arylsulfatase A-like enzyme
MGVKGGSLGRRLLIAASSISLLAGLAPGLTLAQTRGGATSPVLPAPVPPFDGKLGRTVATSSPPHYPAPPTAPKGAPNVLLIMTDDVGFAASSTFGGPISTPTFDHLAAHGLRYNEFHTTALCSPTRAALLTGRNHHSVGAGVVADIATGYPGYNSVIPKSAATIGEVLRQNGYSTAWFGKNHNTPEWENTPIGPYDNWPNGLGFDYFYGFNAGETNQWAPSLVENRNTVEPPVGDPTYNLDHDLADHATYWLRLQHTIAPDKPFLMYIAPGTAHAPHDAPKEWIAKYKGRFDQGWDRLREESFARQKASGVIPANTELTPRPPEIPAWDSLSADQKRVYAHMMEVYAGAWAHADDELGRVIAQLRESGQLDNTLIIYIQGDNGASGEGTLGGTTNDLNALNGITEPFDYTKSRMADMGGPQTTNHYPVGWAWSMDTPFQWTKQIASHFGGTRNGMVLSWPGHIAEVGGLRSQFASVIDIAPTLYEVIGITPPTEVNGVAQKPLEGSSLAYSFNAPTAPSRHTEQYFEMLANRALYKDGWMASTHPKRLPWGPPALALDPDSYTWELYHVADDYSQAHDLAAQNPAKLAELKEEFYTEAAKYQVLPIDARTIQRAAQSARPSTMNGREQVTFYPGPARYGPGAFPDLRNRSWRMTADVVIDKRSADGMIITEGGRFAGWGMMLFGGKPTFIYKRSMQPNEIMRIQAPQALAPGRHKLEMAFEQDGSFGFGLGGTATLRVDGVEAAKGHIAATVPAFLSTDGAAVGHDTGTPLTDEYTLPFQFQGKIERVDIFTPKRGAAPQRTPEQKAALEVKAD